MPEEVKTCKFYSFLQCGETNCCTCRQHPLCNTGHDFMVASERARLAESCTVWLRAHNLPATPANVIEALYQNNVLQASAARLMIASNPPALSDTLKG